MTEPDLIMGGEAPPYEIIRFYFDGLTVLFDCRTFTPDALSARGKILVGWAPGLNFGTVTFEKSFQRENLTHLMLDDLHQSMSAEDNRAERRRTRALARKK